MNTINQKDIIPFINQNYRLISFDIVNQKPNYQKFNKGSQSF